MPGSSASSASKVTATTALIRPYGALSRACGCAERAGSQLVRHDGDLITGGCAAHADLGGSTWVADEQDAHRVSAVLVSFRCWKLQKLIAAVPQPSRLSKRPAHPTLWHKVSALLSVRQSTVCPSRQALPLTRCFWATPSMTTIFAPRSRGNSCAAPTAAKSLPSSTECSKAIRNW